QSSTQHSYSSLYSFFSNIPPTTATYTLSLHDALPICQPSVSSRPAGRFRRRPSGTSATSSSNTRWRPRVCTSRTSSCRKTSSLRSEEHTSELQSRGHLVCRLLLEKKKTY